MGQYYRAVLGNADGNERKIFDFNNMIVDGHKEMAGPKLLEMAWIGEGYADTIEHQLIGNPHRVAWIGDYANDLRPHNSPYETSYDKLLANCDGRNVPTYDEVWSKEPKPLVQLTQAPAMDWEKYILVNYDRKEYIPMHNYLELATYEMECFNCTTKKMEKGLFCLDPLVILTAVGNGEGSGDHYGDCMDKVGAWAWNLISIEPKNNVPEDFELIFPLFKMKE